MQRKPKLIPTTNPGVLSHYMQFMQLCNYMQLMQLCNYYMMGRCGNFNFLQLNATICNYVGTILQLMQLYETILQQFHMQLYETILQQFHMQLYETMQLMQLYCNLCNFIATYATILQLMRLYETMCNLCNYITTYATICN